MLPDDTSSLPDEYPTLCPVNRAGPTALFVETTGDTKPLFSLALFNCPCPEADRVLLALLSPHPPLYTPIS